MNVNLWNDFKKTITNKKIICYGAGNNAYNLLNNKDFKPFLNKILFFVDADIKKQDVLLGNDKYSFEILPVSKIDDIDEDSIVLITIVKYKEIGNLLDKKKIKWFSWAELSCVISLSKIALIGNEIPKIVLMNTPNYLNLGDHAIAIAENLFLSNLFNEPIYEFDTSMCDENHIQYIKQYVSSQDLIFIQGGGNMGSLWKTCENNIRTIIQTFPNNKIIIFPQSVFYENTTEGIEDYELSLKVYNVHPNLTICCRDVNSFDFVKTSYICDTKLLPDMVLYLKNNNISNKRFGIGYLLREDKEALLSDNERKNIKEIINKTGKRINIISHHKNDIYDSREQRLEDILEEYSKCELVITDRLHGMIFSHLTRTPCIVFDNSYKKISGVYNTWLKNDQLIKLMTKFDAKNTEELTRVFLKDITDKNFDNKQINDSFEELKNICIGKGISK